MARIRLEDFPDIVAKQHSRLVRRVALGIWRGCVIGSPVDTGWLRFHWFLTYGQASTFQPGSNEGRDSKSAPSANEEQPPNFPVAFIVNRTPYAKALNDSHPTKAGWVNLAVQNELNALGR